jgi:hypothetical protein
MAEAHDLEREAGRGATRDDFIQVAEDTHDWRPPSQPVILRTAIVR